MNTTSSGSMWRRAAPGLTLMLAAPLCAEVLPGATRLSSLFVLPIEILVWGGGALMIREVARRRALGWFALLLMGLALAIAEECLIQQTSLAPVVIKLKGVEYACAFGVNYVYFLWALVYEATLVVLVPVALVELVFPGRARGSWMNRGCAIAVPILFVFGSFFAWFTWTQIARVKVFHLPAYTPSVAAVLTAIAAIVALIALALRRPAEIEPGALEAPGPLFPGIIGAVAAILWYGLVLLAFGIWPAFPPAAAIAIGGGICCALLLTFPAWSSQPTWSSRHTFAVVFGTLVGSMLVSFAGFIGSAPADLWFKIIADVVATALLWQLGRKVAMRSREGPTSGRP